MSRKRSKPSKTASVLTWTKQTRSYTNITHVSILYVFFLFRSYYSTPSHFSFFPSLIPVLPFISIVCPLITSSCSYVISIIVSNCCFSLDKDITYLFMWLWFVLSFTWQRYFLSNICILHCLDPLNSILLKPFLFWAGKDILSDTLKWKAVVNLTGIIWRGLCLKPLVKSQWSVNQTLTSAAESSSINPGESL